MTQIFLSYAREDSDFCDRLLDELGNIYEVWTDRSMIKGGAEWSKAIEDAIIEAKVFIVVISEDANNSVWVRKETHYAIERECKMIPILLNDQLPITLIDKQYIDFQASFEGGLRDLIEVLNAILGKSEYKSEDPSRFIGDGVMSYICGDIESANLYISQAIAANPNISNDVDEFWNLLTYAMKSTNDVDSLACRFHSLLKFAEKTIRSGVYDSGRAKFRWKIWLDVEVELLEKVEYIKYHLHETFPNRAQIVRNRYDRFALERNGWGIFTIKADIHFVDGSIARISYLLRLNVDG